MPTGAVPGNGRRKRSASTPTNLDDPNHLIAVTARANRSKSDKGPEEWKPPELSYWCRYAVDWVTIKYGWDLTATAAEFAALEEMPATCDVPHELGVVVSVEKPDLSYFGGSVPPPTPAAPVLFLRSRRNCRRESHPGQQRLRSWFPQSDGAQRAGRRWRRCGVREVSQPRQIQKIRWESAWTWQPAQGHCPAYAESRWLTPGPETRPADQVPPNKPPLAPKQLLVQVATW